MWEKKNKWTTKCDKSIVTYNVGTAQCEVETVNCEKKKKRTINCDKSTVKCDVENGTMWGWNYQIFEKIKINKRTTKCPNVTKELSHVMLEELHNIRMESSNVRKKKKKEGNH